MPARWNMDDCVHCHPHDRSLSYPHTTTDEPTAMPRWKLFVSTVVTNSARPKATCHCGKVPI